MPGPVIIEAVVDQYSAMLPAKIKPHQALKFSEALMRGEPNRVRERADSRKRHRAADYLTPYLYPL
jgi:hypothetical protein